MCKYCLQSIELNVINILIQKIIDIKSVNSDLNNILAQILVD